MKRLYLLSPVILSHSGVLDIIRVEAGCKWKF